MNTQIVGSNKLVGSGVPARGGGIRDWQLWAPYAAVAWSFIYAALGVYWAVSWRGFPYTFDTMSDGMGPLLGRFGPGAAWFIEQTSRGTLISHDGTAPDYFAYMALLPDQNRGLVLLVNANEFFINMAFKFVGGDAALVLAGGQPESIPWAVVPWSLRAFLIIPVLQILGVFFTLRTVRRWRKDASRRPGPIRKWFHIGLPAIPNLVLVFCALYLLTSGVLKFWLFYMADLTWLALICGSFALVWIFVRTVLILQVLSPRTIAGNLASRIK